MYKLAIIGYGGMGCWHHKNIQEKIPQIHVKGAYDIRPELEEKARENGIHFYKSPEEIWKDPEVDIVTIATPNNFHKDLVIQSLRLGKHVICEKPVALNTAELQEMVQTASDTGNLFSVHQNRRWDKDFMTIKSILERNLIGEPYYIESRVQGSRRSLHGWRGYKVNGGGMVYDWGVHLVDQILSMTNSPLVNVQAHLFQIFSEEVDDNFKVLLRFENGLSALLEIATNCFINQPRWHISCKEGTAVIEDWDCNGKIVKLSEDAKMEWDNDIIYTSAGPTRTMAPRPAYTTTEIPLPEVEADWSNYYKNIVEVIEGTAELIVNPHQILRTMRAIDAVFLSDRECTAVSCRI